MPPLGWRRPPCRMLLPGHSCRLLLLHLLGHSCTRLHLGGHSCTLFPCPSGGTSWEILHSVIEHLPMISIWIRVVVAVVLITLAFGVVLDTLTFGVHSCEVDRVKVQVLMAVGERETASLVVM